MGGTPYGLRWEAIYPMMQRVAKSDDEWQDLHDALMVMEAEAVDTMREFAPKGDVG